MFANNVDRRRKKVSIVDLVRAVSSDDENRLSCRVSLDGHRDNNLQFVVRAPLEIILRSSTEI